MKKVLLLATALLSMGAAQAENSSWNLSWSKNRTTDMKFYASQYRGDNQKIVTDAGLIPAVNELGYSYSMPCYIVECLSTAQDMNNGDTELGTANVPAGGKVTGLKLPGIVTGGNSDQLNAVTYIKDVEAGTTVAPYQDTRFWPLNTYLTEAEHGFQKLNEETTLTVNNDYIVDLPFDVVYQYAGGDFDLALYLSTPDADRSKNLQFEFFNTNAKAEIATIFHAASTDGANAGTYYNFFYGYSLPFIDDTPAGQAVKEYLDIKPNTLPAFQLDYFTNDIRGEVKQAGSPMANTTVTLFKDGVEIASTTTDENGYFEFINLDYTGNYDLKVDGLDTEATTITFDANDGDDPIENDVYADINAGTPTGVDEIADNAVSSVRYYNLAGVESAQPFDGVNVVVTTMANGAKKVAKIVK